MYNVKYQITVKDCVMEEKNLKVETLRH